MILSRVLDDRAIPNHGSTPPAGFDTHTIAIRRPCAQFDGTFLDAVSHDVVDHVAERAIVVPGEDVTDLRSAVVVP